MSPEYRVGALAKGLHILSCFSETDPILDMREIAARTAIPVATTFRLLRTLDSEGYVERVSESSYRPGPAALTLGFAVLRGMDLVEVSRIPLSNLVRDTGQTVNLGILVNDQVLYIQRLQNTDLVTANLRVGSMLPACCTSMGKLLLAFLAPEEVQIRLNEESFEACQGPNAVKSMEALMKSLPSIYSAGWAMQDEETAAGLRSIAGPVRNTSNDVVAAVNIAVNASQWPIERLVDEVRNPLLKTCDEISNRMGASVRSDNSRK